MNDCHLMVTYDNIQTVILYLLKINDDDDDELDEERPTAKIPYGMRTIEKRSISLVMQDWHEL